MKSKTLYLVLLMLVMMITPSISLAHPADGYATNPLPEGYGTIEYHTGPVNGIGVMTFTCPYPSPESLTEAEKYVIAGTVSGPEGQALQPWVYQIGQVISFYYQKEGYIPGRFSTDMLFALEYGDSTIDDARLDIFRSPITEEFPRLDAGNFSPGDLFVHILSEDEKWEYSEDSPQLRDAWFNKVSEHEGQSYEVNPSPVTYVRVYGENDIIIEAIIAIAAFV